MRFRIALLLCVPLVLSGCYRYVPVHTELPPQGIRLRATVTDVAAAELGGALGRGVQQVEGDVLRAEPEAVLLAIRTVRLRGGDEQYWKGENFALPTRSIAILEERRIDRFRTGLAVGGLAAIIYVLGRATFGGGDGEGRIVVPPPTQ